MTESISVWIPKFPVLTAIVAVLILSILALNDNGSTSRENVAVSSENAAVLDRNVPISTTIVPT